MVDINVRPRSKAVSVLASAGKWRIREKRELTALKSECRHSNSKCYSNYKSTTTWKGLIGITPAGAVSFVSALHTGNISDKKLTKQCHILQLLQSWLTKVSQKGPPVPHWL
jgi:hypothetical protein